MNLLTYSAAFLCCGSFHQLVDGVVVVTVASPEQSAVGGSPVDDQSILCETVSIMIVELMQMSP
ncbi:MAG: hypothetical protein AAGB19_17545 [Cyanobacteria bacterium P01_F01_bin.3]